MITTLLAATVLCQSKPTQIKVDLAKEATSVHKFVQSFYDWYLATEKRRENARSRGRDTYKKQIPYPDEAMDYVAVMTRPEVFSQELRRALIEDRDAQAKEPGVIVGLDFEPILAGQDFPPLYRVEKVARKGSGWYVYVTGVNTDGMWGQIPKVAAVVEKAKNKPGWRFTNFVYHDLKPQTDLLEILRDLKLEREQPLTETGRKFF